MCDHGHATAASTSPASQPAPKDLGRYHQAVGTFPIATTFPPYPCNPDRDWMRLYKAFSINDIHDGHVVDSHRHGCDAVQGLMNFLLTPGPTDPEAQQAEGRLTILAKYEPSRWTPDIVFKAFDDLDEAFFAGTLRGHVHLAWCTEKELVQLRIMTPGLNLAANSRMITFSVLEETGEITGKHGITIRLNAGLIFLGRMERDDDGERISRWRNMWRTLVHEMVHCYLHIVTGFEFPDHRFGDTDPAHGFYFQTLTAAVNERMRPIFGFGAENCDAKYTIPATPEDRRRENAWLRSEMAMRKERIARTAKTPEHWLAQFADMPLAIV